MEMKRTILILIFLLLFTSLLIPQSSKTFVVLKTGEKIFGNVEIETPLIGKDYVTVDDTLKYYLPDISFVKATAG